MRSGARPGKPAGALRRVRGGGTRGRAAARGWSADSEPSRAQPRTHSRVRFLERALAGAATTCLPAPGEFAGVGMCGCSRRGTLRIPSLQSPGPNFPSHPRQDPRADPMVCSSSKLQRGGRWERVRGLGVDLAALTRTPAPAWPCRSAAAQPPPPGRLRGCSNPVPVVGTAVVEGGGRTRAQALALLRKVRIRC